MTRLADRLARSLLALKGVRIAAMGSDAWLLQRGPRQLVPMRIGGPRLNTHVVTTADVVANRTGRYLVRVGELLHEQHLRWLLDAYRVNCVIDVGANRGQFARGLRDSGFDGRIASFEPVAAHVAALQEVAAGDPDWHILPFALGDAAGEATINVSGGDGTTSSLLAASDFGRDHFKDLQEASRTESIQVRRLDSVFDEVVAGIAEPRVFLKLDTQGFDLPALRGAGDRVTDLVGLQSEVSCVPIYEGMPRMRDQLDFYEAAGFEISGMYPVTMDPDSVRTIEFDLLMVRAGTHPRGDRR